MITKSVGAPLVNAVTQLRVLAVLLVLACITTAKADECKSQNVAVTFLSIDRVTSRTMRASIGGFALVNGSPRTVLLAGTNLPTGLFIDYPSARRSPRQSRLWS